ncbi:hypothetical protein E4N85_06220 [Treponema denticola]|uniref:hypothetical protein n=1 Tax=Treponema denticola TaxID=158 RepID=UPI0020A54DB4|nr:hypothetical protein [Treponema denticola]UTC95345.1 hypothetical protein E4N85_06220 [Treponema denticola]
MLNIINYQTNIQKLITEEYTNILCARCNINPIQIQSKVNVPTELTCATEFDLIDKKDEIIVNLNEGDVTYINKPENEIAVTDYERYVLSLPQSMQKGMKRSDFIVYDDKTTGFIILNEIAHRKNAFDKKTDAIHQLSETLTLLCNCPAISKEFEKYSVRACVFSNRYNKISSPMEMADAFNYGIEISRTVSIVVGEDIPSIKSLGFNYYKSSKIDISTTGVKFFTY